METIRLILMRLLLWWLCFSKGGVKLSVNKMPPRRYIETFAEIIYSAAEFVPNGKITIKGIGDWVDGNEQLMGMLQRYEPQDTVSDENSIFLPLPRDENHINILSSLYLGKHQLL